MASTNLAVDFGEVIQRPTIFPDEQGKVEVTITLLLQIKEIQILTDL